MVFATALAAIARLKSLLLKVLLVFLFLLYLIVEGPENKAIFLEGIWLAFNFIQLLYRSLPWQLVPSF